MDLTIALVALAAIVILTIAVYLFSTVPIKSKTFEEAVAEQRKQDEMLFPDLELSEKSSKDKKHKKVVGRKTKEHEEVDNRRPRKDSLKTSAPVNANKDTKENPKDSKMQLQQRQKSPSPSPPKQIRDVAVKEKAQPVIAAKEPSKKNPVAKTDDGKDSKKVSKAESPVREVPKKETEKRSDVVEAKKTNAAGTKKGEQVTKVERPERKKENSGDYSSETEIRPRSKRPQKSASAEAIEVVDIGITGINVGAPAPKKAKRTKGDAEGVGSSEIALNATRLAKLLKNAILSGPDVQMLVDLLLTQTQATSGAVASRNQWQQRGQKDSLETLQDKLAKKDQLLEEERQLTQSAAAKLKDVRQEVAQEKARTAMVDRNLQQRTQELQNLQAQLTTAQQAKSKLSDEHQDIYKKVTDECLKLKQSIAQHEADLKLKHESEIHLQNELEQIRMANDQLKSSESELKMEAQVQEELVQRMREEENNYQQQISEMTKQLQVADSEKNTLQQEIDTLRTRSENANEQNNALQRKLDELHENFNDADNARKSLEDQLQEVNAQLIAAKTQFAEANDKIASVTTELKSSQVETQSAALRLQELEKTLKKLQDELRNEQLKTQEFGQVKKESEKLQSEKAKLADELSKKMVENESKIEDLYSELNKKKEENANLVRDLEKQRAKNDELRQKNWKAVEALKAAENMAADNLAKAKSDLNAETLSQVREKEQATIKQTINRIFPNLRIEKNKSYDIWLVEFEKNISTVLDEHKQYKEKDEKNITQLSESLDSQQKLQTQVQHYQTVLAETEGILNKLQSSVEAEERRWKGEFNVKEVELAELRKNVKNLEEEKVSLETSLEEIRAAEETASEMQEKLCELQYKLQLEENEKRSLVNRCEKAESDLSKLHEKLQQLESGLQAKSDVQSRLSDTLLELDGLKADLEKERKLYKELSLERARLNGLVKIGQDSLREEQERSNSLQVQLDSLKKNPAINGLPSESITETEGTSDKK